jgi:Mn2+/Fe2+ NRAMP family transporter
MYPGRVVIYGQAGKKYTVGFLFINFVLSVVKYFYCAL